ncbi:MAG: hypothetical protein K8L99_33090 [Anaerolineae bacterium]|nr:hypothetical protein [Anaerolineae bacterium]
MPDDIRAKGYISVYLVMDMKPFVHPSDRQRFETIRGYRAFADVLHDQWPRQMQDSAFHVVDEDLMAMGQSPVMSTDEVGFVTGIFRSNMLDLYSSPLYRVNKDEFQFPEPVTTNLQFDKLFKPIWDNWEICVRPTMTGMLVVRLTRNYDKPSPLLTQTSDVIELQQPFDVPSAIKALNKLQAEFTSPGHTTEERNITKRKMESTYAFLEWLGVHNHDMPELDYIPLQWQLASEIGQQFIRDVGSEIRMKDGKTVKLHSVKPDLSTTLYDSYTVYHFDRLVADPLMIKPPERQQPTDVDVTETQETKRQPTRNLVTVQPSDVKRSIRIKWCLVGMIEGAILSKSATSGISSRHFPRHNLGVVERVFKQDIATWADELCVLTSRTAIIMPSHRSSREHLFVSKLDAKTTTTYVEYTRYWEALERLVEFVLEINMLSQLVENSSALTLQQFVNELDHARRNILNGNLNGTLQENQRRLSELTNASANLSRLVGVCQGLINPNFWSRAEYAVEKASHLMREMEVALLLGHAERNVSNLTDLVDHVDEIYLAQLSERSNEQNSRQSIILAGLSLSIILFTLPSFWADINQLNSFNSVINFVRSTSLLGMLALLGSILAPIIFVGSIIMALWAALPERYKSWPPRKPPSSA